MRDDEQNEFDIAENLRNMTIDNFKYRSYNPGAIKLLRPTQSINRLIGASTNANSSKLGGTNKTIASDFAQTLQDALGLNNVGLPKRVKLRGGVSEMKPNYNALMTDQSFRNINHQSQNLEKKRHGRNMTLLDGVASHTNLFDQPKFNA